MNENINDFYCKIENTHNYWLQLIHDFDYLCIQLFYEQCQKNDNSKNINYGNCKNYQNVRICFILHINRNKGQFISEYMNKVKTLQLIST